jgi:hypothetical protein
MEHYINFLNLSGAEVTLLSTEILEVCRHPASASLPERTCIKTREGYHLTALPVSAFDVALAVRRLR